jgi:Methyltransferase FkbM domain
MSQQHRMWARDGAEERYRVTCYPLTDLLKAIGVNHVDFFSLDTQGGELKILKTIDFQAVRIDILTIEVEDDNVFLMRQKLYEMRQFFNQTGLYIEVTSPQERDLMFERIDLVS